MEEQQSQSRKRKFDEFGEDRLESGAEGKDTKVGEKEHRKDKSQKFILFVGNISSDVTQDQLAQLFTPCGETPTIRIRKQRGERKGRGGPFAFVEFKDKKFLQAALRLHGTQLGKTRIRVELTAGGGGNNSTRQTKIVEHRKRLEAQRQRKVQRGDEKEEKKDADANDNKQAGVSKAKKRAGNRKAKFSAEKDQERPKKKIKPSGSGANAMPLG